MSDTSIGNTKQLMKQPNEDISKATGQFSTAADDSNEILTAQKNFCDMPTDVVGLIIKKADYKEQLILRKTSKSLRALVDKQQPACTRFSMSCMFDFIVCNYNGHRVAYVPPNWNHEEFSSQYENCRLDKIISTTDYEKVAFDDLNLTLKNPKLQLDNFSFDSEEFDDIEEYGFECEDHRNCEFHTKFKKMQKILKSINHQLSVKECGIDVTTLSNVMSILPFLKPGVLDKITFLFDDGPDWYYCSKTMRKIARLEQWKQAKKLELECGFDDKFLVNYATHFERYQFHGVLINRTTLANIRDCILKHEKPKFCSITAVCLNAKYFDSVIGKEVSPGLSHYTIPDSNYYLEFMIKDKLITIEKKTK